MKKKYNICTLPSNTNSLFGLMKREEKFHFYTDGVDLYNHEDNLAVPQHLYITSDEKVEEGDYVIDIRDKTLMSQCTESSTKVYNNQKEFFKKIIATTDKSLKVAGEQAGDNVWMNPLPGIQQSFIEEWCKNPVDVVELECLPVARNTNGKTFREHLLSPITETALKLTPDNEVIASIVEEKMYTAKEVDMKMNELLCDLLVTNRNVKLLSIPNTNDIAQFIMDWSEKNL